MTTPDDTSPAELSYPRQEALTRRFQLGRPRGFTIAPDGSRVVFIRSAGGRDPRGSLWVAEASDGGLQERCVVDVTALQHRDGDVPAAERARRERMRETTSGITAFSTDREVTRAAFAIDGALMVADLRTGEVTELPASGGAERAERPHPETTGGVVDPRMSPDGRWVAFVSDRSLHVVATDGRDEPRCLAQAGHEHEAWGLADFVAAEELDRVRGLWWLADSSAVLAENMDESDVEVRWISDPARPADAPHPHRYPAAGTANPRARLFVLPLDGPRVEVEWDHDAYPYLATVHPDSLGDSAVVSVLSRDQSKQRILGVDSTGRTHLLRDRSTQPWVTMQPGVPRRHDAGALLEIVADTDTDSFRLVRDGAWLTPPGLQVTGLVGAEADGIVITAQANPMDQGVYRLDASGELTSIADAPGIHAAVSGPGGSVIMSTHPEVVGARFHASLVHGAAEITSLAERPVVAPVVTYAHTDSGLPFAVILPTGHVAGSARLPVVMAPYGGPHHARLIHAAGAFASDQWLADQGFAVVVVDGAGTPGRGPGAEFSVHGDLATQVLQDQVDGLRAAARLHPDLDLTRVGITGWSFGGYLAALAVLDRPDVFHAAVAGAPVTDWALYDTAYTERYLGTPQVNPDAYHRASLIERAGRLERPLLIIHGLADDNVLAAHTLQLSSALLAAGRPHSVLPLSGVTHMTPQEVVAENLLRLEVDFLRSHLQG